MTLPLFASPEFEATPAAARARVAAVRPGEYARTRNHLNGAVTRLSPTLTHGCISLQQVLAGVLQRGPLPIQHKLVFELAWREYFQHVWQHLGDGIFESLHAGPLPEGEYSRDWPADIREARSGVPVVDQAVRTLLSTGYLHNHARMWLASYAVHLRKLHWRCGADWMYGHLLDGDLASNHLSWQWVAGTGSSKPYLFNAENVARYAEADWHSPGSVIDTSYETLDQMARDPAFRPAPWRGGSGMPEPALWAAPPDVELPAPTHEGLQGRRVALIHPWDLGEPDAAAMQAGVLRVGLLVSDLHQRWPWSAGRWALVLPRLQALCDHVCIGSAAQWQAALQGADVVHLLHERHLAGTAAWPWTQTRPTLLPWPARRCASFSRFFQQATQGLTQAGELLPPS